MIKIIRHAYRLTKSKLREKRKSKQRSPKWDETRDVYIKLHNECEACGFRKNLQVHHIKPFHSNPEYELDMNNLITLCMGPNECHINLGHGDNFKCHNPNIKNHAAKFRLAGPSDRKLLLSEAKSLREK